MRAKFDPLLGNIDYEAEVVDDTTPQLGGDLDGNGKNITTTGTLGANTTTLSGLAGAGNPLLTLRGDGQTELWIDATTGIPILRFQQNTNDMWVLNVAQSNGRFVFSDGAERMCLTRTTGRLGINTDAPDSRVHIVDGNSSIKLGALPSYPDFASIHINQASPNSTNYTFAGNSTTGQFNAPTELYMNISDSAKFRISSTRIWSGLKLGVDVISPTEKLEVNGNFSNYTAGTTSIVTGDSSTFTAGIGGWTYWYGTTGGTFTAVGGKGVISLGAGYYYWSGMVTGTTYTISMKIKRTSGSDTTFPLASGASGSITGITTSEQTLTTTFKATAATLGILFPLTSAFEIDDVSLIGPTSAKWVFPGQTTGASQTPAGNLMVDNGLVIGATDIPTTTSLFTVSGLGNKTAGIFNLGSTSAGADGALAKIGPYSYWNSDSAGALYWFWGARWDGETNAWVRAYTAADNWLPYTKYGTSGTITFGGAATNDKTNLVPVPTDRVTFDMSTGYVGIGKSPAYKFDVGASTDGVVANFLGGAAGVGIIRLNRTSGTTAAYTIGLPSGILTFTDDINAIDIFSGVYANSIAYGTLSQMIAGRDYGANAFNGAPGMFRAQSAGTTGTDTYGGDLYLAGGKGRGDGTRSKVVIATPDKVGTGTTIQVWTDKLWVDGETLSQRYRGSATAKTDFVIDSTGEVTITSPTAKTPVFSPVVYEDLQVNVKNIVKGASAPTDRTYAYGVGGGIAYPTLGFAKDNYVWFDVQTTHGMKLNTVLDTHIHFVLPNTTTIGHKIVWQLDVLVAGVDGTWSVPTGSPFTATHTVATDDNIKHRLLQIADIPASNTTVSSIYKCKLTRIDGTATEYASEVYVEYIDCHYQKDTIGSRSETAK